MNACISSNIRVKVWKFDYLLQSDTKRENETCKAFIILGNDHCAMGLQDGQFVVYALYKRANYNYLDCNAIHNPVPNSHTDPDLNSHN